MVKSCSGSVLDRARRFLAGGTLGMFRLPAEVETVFVRGKGSRIYDIDGREYIDFVMGSGPLILGHAHPEVTAAIQRGAAAGTTFYGLSAVAVDLAERVVDASPCGQRLRFTCSGTEATFAALRLARAFTGRSCILKFDGGWHGAHDVAQVNASASGGLELQSGGIPPGVLDTVLVAPFNDPGTATDLIAANAARLAAVIVEPMQRAIPPEPGFLEALRRVTERHGVLLIFDEVVTGFRLAWGGAQERYGVVPDLAAYGKTISGGLPLAAVCGRADVVDCADSSRRGRPDYAFVSGTFNGNPLSAAAGLATLDVLEGPGVYPRLDALGRRLREGLEAAGRESGLPLQVLGEGPVLQPFFADHSIGNHAEALAADNRAAVEFGIGLLREGLFVTPGAKLYLSLAHSDEDVDRLVEAAGRVLTNLAPVRAAALR